MNHPNQHKKKSQNRKSKIENRKSKIENRKFENWKIEKMAIVSMG